MLGMAIASFSSWLLIPRTMTLDYTRHFSAVLLVCDKVVDGGVLPLGRPVSSLSSTRRD